MAENLSYEENALLIHNSFEPSESHDSGHNGTSPVPTNMLRSVPLGDDLRSHHALNEPDDSHLPRLSEENHENLPGHKVNIGVATLPDEPGPNASATSQIRHSSLEKKRSRHRLLSSCRRDRTRRGEYSWTWEFIALAVSLASMIVMISLLIWADGRPLVDWNFFLSFNTIISILGAICRAPFIYVVGSCLSQAKWNWFRNRSDTLITYARIDSASRGPLGSVSLAYHIHLRHWIILGALVTIALTVFEPFLQAIVLYSGQTELPGTILAAVRLDGGVYTPQPSAAGQGMQAIEFPSGGSVQFNMDWLSRPDVGLVSALLNGFDKQYHSFQLTSPWSCPSGNCDWAPFTSAAICSACYNVSDHLKTAKLFANSSSGTISLPSNEKADPNSTLTRYSLPLVSIENFDQGMEAFMALVVAAATNNPGRTLSFQRTNTMLAAYQIIKPERSYESGQTLFNESQIFATECGFYLCAQAYKASVTNGTMSEQVLGSWTMRTSDSYAIFDTLYNASQVAEYDNWNNYSLVSQYADPTAARGRIKDFERADLVLEISEDALRNANVASNATRFFNFTQNMTASTAYFLASQVTGSKSLLWPLVGEYWEPVSEIVTQALYESDDLDATFQQAAKSMTNWARHTSSVPYFSARKDLLIQIRWAYLVWPVASLIAGSIFILLSIFETRRVGLKPWKDDFIFGLIHALDPESAERLRAAEQQKGNAKELSKTMLMHFADDEGTWQLRARH